MNREQMPLPGAPVLVALSGGADSVFLLRILLDLGYAVAAAHCNYGLRLEADEDEAFVQQLCNALNVRLDIRRFSRIEMDSDGGEGLQAHARRLRYAFFEEVMARDGIPNCATGHHADDQLETLVQSFFRSRGPRLFHPIPSRRGAYFRPLLCLERQEIETELRALGQDWRHDRSNDRLDYSRNRIRHQLLPLLGELFPGFEDRFLQQSERHEAHWKWIAQLFQPISLEAIQQVTGGELISFEVLAERLGEGGFAVFLDWWMQERSYLGVEIGEVQRLAKSAVGATYICTRARVARDRAGLLFLNTVSPPMDAVGIEIPLTAGRHNFGHWEFDISLEDRRPEILHSADPETHVLDLERLQPPLRIRSWRVGDRMQPFGLKGSKLLSDVFADQKRTLPEKESASVIEDGSGIVLVGGYRIADRVAVGPTSRQFLIIRIHQSL